MIWELLLSAIFTAIAVITAVAAIVYFLYRRMMKERSIKTSYAETPHIESAHCRCYFCKLERETEK